MVVCKFFQRGFCKFGSSCRFEHIGGGQQNYGGSYYSNNYTQPHPSYNGKHAFMPSQNLPTSNRFGVLSDNRSDGRSPKSANTFSGGRQETFDDFVVATLQEADIFEKGKLWPFSVFGLAKTGSTLHNYPGLQDISPEELRWEAYQNQQQGSMTNYVHGVEQLFRSQQVIRQEIKSRSASAMDILNRIFHNQPLPAYQTGQSNAFGQVSGNTTSSSFNFNLMHLNQSSQSQIPFSTSNVSGSSLVSANDPPKVNNPWPAFAAAPLPQQTGFTLSAMTNSASVFGSGPENKVFSNPAFEPTQPTNPSASFGGNPPAFNNNINSNTNPVRILSNAETAAPDKMGSDTYSPLDRLTIEERQQFEASAFSLGMIPVQPPPKEFCI